MSTATEELRARIHDLDLELQAWCGGERSMTNTVPYLSGEPEYLAVRENAVAMKDAAHVTALAAQLSAAVALLQLEGGAR